MDRLAMVGFAGLDEAERILASVWLFEAGVGNQGFVGYYAGGKSDLSFFAPTALRMISANELAEIADQANGVFGPEGPSQDRELRRERVHALPESARELLVSLERRYFDCEEDADRLLEVYLSQRSAKV